MRTLIFEYENHNGLQLIISAKPAIDFSQVNQFENHMLKQNILEGYLPCELEIIDDEYKFHYPIVGYKKLQHYMQVNCHTQHELYQIYAKLIAVMKRSYSYMLTPNGSIIHSDAMFYDEGKQEILLAYLPVQQKGNMSETMLQWLLYWSNQVEINDYQHLHKLFSLFTIQDFSLDKLEQELLDYVYQQQNIESAQKIVSPLSPLSNDKHIEIKDYIDSEKVAVKEVLKHEKLLLGSIDVKNNGQSSLKSPTIQDDLNFIEENFDKKKDNGMTRLILLCFIVCCAPIAVLMKLYIPSPTLSHLFITIGVAVVSCSVIGYFIYRHISAKRNSREGANYLAEDTADQTPPFRYYEAQNQNKSELVDRKSSPFSTAPLEQLKASKVSSQSSSQSSSVIRVKTLDTVQMSKEDRTVQLQGDKVSNVSIVRSYNQDQQIYPLTHSMLTVGRSIDGVHINDEFTGVSRLHIQFEYKNGLVIAKDLGSRNGSFLNKKLMTPYKHYVISEQDHIQLIGHDGPIYSVKEHS